MITVRIDGAERKAYATISSEGGWPSVDDVVNAARTESQVFWINEPAIAKALDKHLFDTPFEIGVIKDGRVLVTVPAGEKEAYMLIEPAYGGRDMDLADVEQALSERSVVFGIDGTAIGEAIASRDYGRRIRIALAKDPVNGTNAAIEYLFSRETIHRPKDTNDQPIDYRDLESVTSVHKGAVLAVKTPATPGDEGTTVTGRSVRPLPGKDTRLAPGKNTRLSEDGLQLISDIEGQPVVIDKISVEPIVTIDGDIDYSTGNIDFAGSLKVTGSIISGFSVKASANIQIDGIVEDSHVEAGGEVLIKGGVRGRGKETVKAGGSVHARFIEQALIKAGSSIVAQEILHSQLMAGDQVVVTSGKGLISGGRITATNLIHANIVGAHSGVRTELMVGFDPEQKARLEALKEKRTRREVTLAEVEAGIGTLEKYRSEGSSLWPRHEETYRKLLDTRQQLEDSLSRPTYEIGVIKERLVRAEKAVIKITRTIYPNVVLRIGYAQFQNETELAATIFYEDEEEIKATAYIF
jgi:uncharacterized protein